MGKLRLFKDGTAVPCWYPFWSGRSWCYDFYVDGIRYRASSGVRDSEAPEIAIAVAKGVHEAAWARALSPYPTFEEAAELYIAEFGKNEGAVRRLAAYFGPHVGVDEITPFMIDQAIVDLYRPTWTSINTARKQIVMPLQAVMNFGLGKRPRKWAPSRREYVLSPEEAELLIVSAQHPERAGVRDPDLRLLKLITFELSSGAASGEAHQVRAEDFNWPTRQVWVCGTKTEYRQRWVDLPERANDLMGALPTEGLVFLTPTGRPIKTDGEHGTHLIRAFHKLCAAAGLPADVGLCFYTLRHTNMTWFSAQVGDHDLLIDRGGWVDGRMARHYRKRPERDLADRLLAHGWDFRR